jgi:small-conductance mechanosensitive channel
LRVWTEIHTHTTLKLKSDLYFTLFKRFGEAEIELPFPQRDLHLRSSDIPLIFPTTPADSQS